MTAVPRSSGGGGGRGSSRRRDVLAAFVVGIVLGQVLHYDAGGGGGGGGGFGKTAGSPGGPLGSSGGLSFFSLDRQLRQQQQQRLAAGFDGGGEAEAVSAAPDTTDSNSENKTKRRKEKQEKTFAELVIESGSDKYHRHHYETYYERWLEPYRYRSRSRSSQLEGGGTTTTGGGGGLKLLEIGAASGNSLALWNSYFSPSDDNKDSGPELILGLAYGEHTKNLEERMASEEFSKNQSAVQILWGDQSKRETMEALVERGPYDVIIDDGSHVPQHVLFSLWSLWETAVKPGGLYVIEDLETNYWPDGTLMYEYPLVGVGIGAGPDWSVVAKLQQVEQVLVRHQIGARHLSVMPGDGDVCSIEWGMNLVALRKCDTADTDTDITEHGGEDTIRRHHPKPPYQRRRMYDEDRMNEWIQTAKSTNPF